MALADGGWKLIESNDVGGPYGEYNYTEYEESGDCEISEDGSSFTRIFQVDDYLRLNFLDNLYGYSTYANGDNGPILRILPEMHNEALYFYCTSAHARRLSAAGSSGGLGKWKTSQISAQFKPTKYNVLADSVIGTLTFTSPIDGNVYTVPNELQRYVERRYNYVINQVTTSGLMKFVSRYAANPNDNNVIQQIDATLNQAPGQMFMYLEKELIWHSIPARESNYWEPPNRKTAEALAGCINTTSFDWMNPGTAVFAGVQYEMKKPTLETGLYHWDITYRFMCMDHGLGTVTDINGDTYTGYIGPDWIYDQRYKQYMINGLYVNKNNGWDLVSMNGTVSNNDTFIYPPGDLNALFAIQANS